MQSTLRHSLRSASGPVTAVLAHVFTPAFVRRLSIVTTVGMFLVVIMGTLVTNTNSAQGCGNQWPLCKGQFIPQFAVSTAIEWSHRAVTGLESLLVLAMTIGVLAYWRSRREIKILAPVMVIFLLMQAALGAMAVIWLEPPFILALHFGVSLISFASIVLTTLFICEIDGWDTLRDVPFPRSFARLCWGLIAFTYLVVYLGAYVRHNNVSLACTGWPLCNGHLYPGFAGGVGIVFDHRISALLLTAGLVWLFIWARSLRDARPDLYWGSVAALLTVVLQALAGAIVVWSRLDLFSTLAHGGIVALLFGAQCYLCMHTFRRPRRARTTEPSTARSPSSSIATATSTH